ncbi:hypothetical protein ACU686_21280 [Yinghuangia aomiensis]
MRGLRPRRDLPAGDARPRRGDPRRRILAPLKEQVKARGLWAAHLPPDLGGQGFGQVRAWLMHEILGRTPYGPVASGTTPPTRATPSSSRTASPPPARDRQREKWRRNRSSTAASAAPSR